MISSPLQDSTTNSGLMSPAAILAALRSRSHKATPLNINNTFSLSITKTIQDAQNDDDQSQNTKYSSSKENTSSENSPIPSREGGQPRDMTKDDNTNNSMYRQETFSFPSILKESSSTTTFSKGIPQSVPIHIKSKFNVREDTSEIRRSSLRDIRRGQSEDSRSDAHYSFLEQKKNKKVTFLLDDCSPVPSPARVLTPSLASSPTRKKNEARKIPLSTQEKPSPTINFRNIQLKLKISRISIKLAPRSELSSTRKHKFHKNKSKTYNSSFESV